MDSHTTRARRLRTTDDIAEGRTKDLPCPACEVLDRDVGKCDILQATKEQENGEERLSRHCQIRSAF